MNLDANAGSITLLLGTNPRVSRHLWCLDWIYHGDPRSPSRAASLRDPLCIKLSSLVSCMANWGETRPFIVEGRVHRARPGAPSLYLLWWVG